MVDEGESRCLIGFPFGIMLNQIPLSGDDECKDGSRQVYTVRLYRVHTR